MVPIMETAASVISRKIVSFKELKKAIIGDEPVLFVFFTFYTFLILFHCATTTTHDCQEKINIIPPSHEKFITLFRQS
jgi:hypothetical protein